MAQAVRYDIKDIKGVVWLQDLAVQVAPIDNAIAVLLHLESRREENWALKRFREMTGQLREDLAKAAKTKTAAAGCMVQGVTYEVRLGDESEAKNEAIPTITNIKSKQKRAGIDNTANNTHSIPKRQIWTCEACRGDRHDLKRC